jgi:pimeloyl-ACP methyl ester carboxylesterase
MINRRLFSSTVAAGAAASLLSAITRAATAQETAAVPVVPAGPAPRVRNVVLVHGAYADGSCWLDVIGRLQAAGLRATAVQNSLNSLQDDVAATRRILALQDGPTVLVGHSFAGMIISEAGTDPKVASLVYVAARGPDAGEDYTALAAKYPRPPASNGLVAVDGFAQLSEEAFLKYFAGDVDPIRARALYAVQGRVSTSLFSGRTTAAAWRSKPSWYQVSKNDMTISPDLQRFMAARMKAKTIELESSHVSLISHPAEIANLILEAAANS